MLETLDQEATGFDLHGQRQAEPLRGTTTAALVLPTTPVGDDGSSRHMVGTGRRVLVAGRRKGLDPFLVCLNEGG